ncbi:MAG: hypothetical protein IJV44_01845 [Prevotella sp.]|nr:hypothetical protein [Prevotella sp.]
MKKLFTLLTLALISIGSAWGDSKEFVGGTSDGQLNVSGGTSTGTLTLTPVTVNVVAPGGKTQNRQIWKDGSTAKNEMAFSLSSSAQSDPTTKYVEITIADGYQITGLTVRGAINGASGATYYAYCFSGAFSTSIGAVTGVGELAFPGYEGTSDDANVSMTGIVNGTRTIRIYRQVRYDSSGKTIDGTSGSNYPSTAPTSVNIAKITVTYEATRTATSEVLKSSAAVKVDDTALTKDAATNGYSIDGTTITVSDDITSLSAPTNVELVKTITYDDSSTKDEDVAVTFDGTVTSGYYIGTATIGLSGSETDYTVRVKKDVTPTIALTEASGTISLNSYTPTGSKTVTLTGSNLTNGEYTVTADVAGTTISPTSFTVASGEVNQEFTITSTASSAASTVFTFGTSGMGTTAPTYTLTYSKTAKRSVSQTDVTSETTWDWANAVTTDANIELSSETDPKNGKDFLMSDIAEIDNDGDFKSQALVINCQYPYRKDGSIKFTQVNKISFNASVPGTVTVEYANTGGNAARTVLINNISKGTKSSSNNKDADYQSEDFNVPAGTITIKGVQVSDNADKMLRIRKIVFTPLTEGDVVQVTTAAYATHVLADDIDFTKTAEVTAYKAKVNGDVIELTEVEQAPAGTPLIIAATTDVYTLEKADVTPAAVTDNDLTAGPVTGDGTSYYVLGKVEDKVGFGPLASGKTLPATKAYIPASKFSASREFIEIDINGFSTGIQNIKVGSDDNVYYDLQGRRVLYPIKGLYIVNGKKVIIK